MKEKEVLLLLTDEWSDWEASFAVAYLNLHPEYAVKTVALDTNSKTSVGGIRAEIDYDIGSYHNFDKLSMVIMTGSNTWRKSDYPEIVEFIQNLINKEIPIAAICGAVYFLGEHSFLDHIKHTGNSLEFLKGAKGYKGDAFFVPAQAVAAGTLITANHSAAVEFAYEIFKILKLGDDYEDKSKWFDCYKNGLIR